MTIVKSEMGNVFGGFTDIPWELYGGRKSGNGNSFVFSLREDSNFVKLKCLEKNFEVIHDASYLTAFGHENFGFML